MQFVLFDTNTYTQTQPAHRPHKGDGTMLAICVTLPHNTVCPACVGRPSVQTRQGLSNGGTINNQDSGLSSNKEEETEYG